MFLRCAQLGQADYLVSADKDLLSLQVFKNTQILSPGEFVDLLSVDLKD
jgi:predicted nucleic acid-binding protein